MFTLIDTIVNGLNRVSPILIQAPWPKNIGNCAEEIRYGLLKAQREGKRVLFLFHRHELWGRLHVPVANRELFLLESTHIVPADGVLGWIGGWILTAVYAVIRPLDLLRRSQKLRRSLARIFPWVRVGTLPLDLGPAAMPIIGTSRLWQGDETAFSWDVVQQFNWREQYDRYDPPRLTTSRRRLAEQARVEMGIPLDAWFVALHIREGQSSGGRSVNYRNASIDNYLDAVRVITSAGGWVVRLGDTSMTRFPAMERVIDYAHSRWKSALMDLYLVSECRFYFGTTSGPYDAALLLGRAVLTVNASEWSIWSPLGPGDLGIMKHVFSRRLGRVLSIRELLEEPYYWQGASTMSDFGEYELIENSAEEIRDVLEEFMTSGRGRSELQRTFNAARSRALHRLIDGGEPKGFAEPQHHVMEQYRIAARADSAAGTLGRKYLEQNWHAAEHDQLLESVR